jgi:hypothetical protein
MMVEDPITDARFSIIILTIIESLNLHLMGKEVAISFT